MSRQCWIPVTLAVFSVALALAQKPAKHRLAASAGEREIECDFGFLLWNRDVKQ
jgi:hypothetical protein